MGNLTHFFFRQAGILLLIVSAAGCKVVVPDVVNLPQLAAESALAAAGYSMSVNEYGSLTATGTAEAPVIFTGAEAVPGYWDGLRFYNSNSESNMLSYVKVEFGGGYFDANLYVTGSAANPTQIHATHCAFENSAQWGVLLKGVVEVNEDMGAVNSFSGNAAGDIEGL
ncbi:MAG TPA: hypothetical protein ENN29_11650 [Candidatus Hydrogenedentes bacterium]|nr:hypothetical protein [Candidatus Hydrogenedentota bacterium]